MQRTGLEKGNFQVSVRGIYTAQWTGEGPVPGICKGNIYSALDWRRARSRHLYGGYTQRTGLEKWPILGICKRDIYSALGWRRPVPRICRGIYTAHWTGEGQLPGICMGDIYGARDWRRSTSRYP